MPSIHEIEAFSIESSHESECPSHSILSAECNKKANITKVYHAKTENINVLQNADENAKKSSFESGDVDNVLSGESLYKTFTFEQSSDEDVEKCIAFWKSVMQKNLEPIKCSIIESSKTKGEPESTLESFDISDELKKTAKITEEKIHGYYKNLFTTTLKELQKRRLNEVKLIGKSRCKMCESQISPTEDLDSDQTEEILGLNNWEPKSKERNISKLASQKTTGGEESLKASQKSAKTAVCICEPVIEAPHDTESVETIVSDRIHIIPNTDRYKLVNLIGEKRRTGAYSRWRKNITKPCTCEVDTCDCNLNPAIISWKPPDKTCGCGQLQCQCKIDSEKLPQQGGDGAKQGKAAESTDLEEEVSQQCLCGNENCTCNQKSPELKKSEDTIILLSSSSSDGSSKDTSSKSKETIIVKLGEAEPHHIEDLYRTGPIKKSSKADVTKCDDIYNSHITLASSKIELNEQECLCNEKCDNCMKQKVSKTVESNQ